MLVTVSGMVGSGKSTAVARIVQLLRQEGFGDVDVWNFRSLPCFGGNGEGEGRRTFDLTQDRWSNSSEKRGHGYSRQRLTASRAIGYIARSVAFRIYCLGHRGTHVCNRYFFDNFSHFELTTWSERFWLALIRASFPRPDLALLLVASLDTIGRRRSNYSPEYLTQVWEAYDGLTRHFGELQVFSTDHPGTLVALDAAVRGQIGRT